MPEITFLVPGTYRIGGINTNCNAGDTHNVTEREAHALAILTKYAEIKKEENGEQKETPKRKRKNVQSKRETIQGDVVSTDGAQSIE